MEHRTLGRTGLQVGFVGLGTEYLINLPRATMASVLERAVEAGVNYVDLLYNHSAFLDDFGPAIAPHREHMVVCVHWGVGERDGQDPVALPLEVARHPVGVVALSGLDADHGDRGGRLQQLAQGRVARVRQIRALFRRHQGIRTNGRVR